MKHDTNKPWFNLRWSLIFLGYIGILVVISILAYRRLLPWPLTSYDKLGHFVLFGSAGLLSHLALNCRSWSLGKISIPVGPCLIALLVIVDELCQSLSPNRTAGLPDLIANWLGIIAFVSIGMIFIRKRKMAVEK